MYPDPERWQITAPRAQKMHHFITNPTPREEWAWADIPHILFDPRHSAWDAWSQLAKPYTDQHRKPSQPVNLGNFQQPKQGDQENVTRCSAFEALPAELLAMVLDEDVLTMDDLFALGLASTILWPHILEYIRTDCKRDVAPLAGMEIACTGTQLGDFPESFLRDGLIANSVSTPVPTGYARAREQNWGAHFQYAPLEVRRDTAWISSWHNVAGFAMGDMKRTRMYRQLLDTLFTSKEYDSEDGWMLRNLTTKEYVRCQYVRSEYSVGPPLEYGCVLHPKGSELHIDDVLLMRICWSKARGDGLDDLYRGKWAGHRFDIIPFMSNDSSQTDGDLWKDCTSEVVNEAAKWKRKLHKLNKRCEPLPWYY